MDNLKNQSKIQSSENVKTNKNKTQTGLDALQKSTDTASNSSKPKEVQTKFLTKSKPVQKSEIFITIKSVISHISHSSPDDFAQLIDVLDKQR